MFGPHVLRLRGRLILLASAALLPVVALAIAGLVVLTRQQSANIERANVETARALMAAIDNELNRSVAALETLAASESLERDDLPAFYESARRVLTNRPSWATIVLLDPSGRQLLNLRLPLGASLPIEPVEKESFDAVIRERRPVIGAMLLGAVPATPVFNVRVPVYHGRELRYVLTVDVEPQALLEVIRRQEVPAAGLVTIFDSNGTIVARSRAHEQFAGRPVSEGFRRLISGGREGWGVSPTVDGQRVYAAYNVSEWSRWGVGLGIPGEAIDTPVLRSYVILAAGVLLSLLLGAAGAVFVARRITGPIAELRAAAADVGRGMQPPLVKSSIPEIRDVASALASAAEARRRAEAARDEVLRLEREARAAAENASRMKDEFLAMLGHELRNPLAAIRNAVHLLERAHGADPVAARAHRILERQVEHLVHLVDDLLDVERLMAGKVALERSPLELATAVGQTLAALRAAGKLERHELSVRAEEAWVEADATRIDQIVANLLLNAIKYTPPRGRIEVEVAKEGNEAVLRVRDEGAGIEPGLMPRLFELFVQGERSLERAQGGLGIGLALVRRLAELHGGSVSVHSDGADKGSLFTVRLPAIPAPMQRPQPSVTPAAPARRILVVEDNDDVRATMRQLLETSGHVVHEAADGPEGLRAALALRPEVAFIDLGLPGFDGYELARRMREADIDSVRLVALTGYGQPQDRRRSLEAGFHAHLVKPVDRETLDRALAL